MEQLNPSGFLISLFLFFSIASSLPASGRPRTYIIHMDKAAMPSDFSTHHDWYMSTLSSLSSSPYDGFSPLHLYTYNHVIDGFSAVLSQTHLDQLHELPGHIATYPETFGHLHTTRTPTFLGLKKHTGLWPAGGFGDDMIIGVLDTGIWPESESFNDQGLPPVPDRWRGACETGDEFNSSYCNRKLIGARSFSKGMKHEKINITTGYDYDSPRDYEGHGTHTSSTVAGSRVVGVDYFGYAKGTAIGIAPKARIAMYKVLFFDDDKSYTAAATDVLAGMDQAIEDGVDVMSLSLGFIETLFEENPIAIGAFAALKKGIFVSCSAGNNGPHAYTILNGAPWITTVGAGTIDREFAAQVTIGTGVDEGLTVTGKTVYPENLFVFDVPIYFGHGNRTKELCQSYSLDRKEVEGKYLFCDFDTSGEQSAFQQTFEMDRNGATGAIFSSDDGLFFRPTDFYKPFVLVNPKDGELVKNYIINSKNATVSIRFQTTLLGTKPAPQVADFSSRGPDRRSPWILKPDILAPGVDILAAWAPNRGFAPIGDDYDYLLTDYALVSGTSMSCPHAAGIASLLKATHRDWSPAAIRSAMMTTADIIDNANGGIIDMITGVPGTPLDFGAGHINPNKAMDPGLVYDLDIQDYIDYLCGLDYNRTQIRTITATSDFTCDNANLDLNYPSFILILNDTNTTSFTFQRELTNVEDGGSVYRGVVRAPSGMKAVVQPATITFAGKYSKAKFQLTVDIDVGVAISPQSDYYGNHGFLSWYEINGKHEVTSPIVSAFAA